MTFALVVAPSSILPLGRNLQVASPYRSKAVVPAYPRASRTALHTSLSDTGYTLADAVSKVADKADKAVGSVNAPGWVLPVS